MADLSLEKYGNYETAVAGYQRQFIDNVTPIFNDGVENVFELFKILLCETTSWCDLNDQEANNIISQAIRHVNNAHDNFERAKNESSRIKRLVDSLLEEITSSHSGLLSDLANLENKIKQQQISINSKREMLKSAETSLKTSQDQLKMAEANLTAAEEKHHNRTKKKRRGLFGIPVVGDIAAEVSGLNASIKTTRRNRNYASEEVRRSIESLDKRKKELHDVEHELSGLEANKKTIEDKIEKQKEHITKLKHIQEEIVKVHQSVAQCTQYISLTFGKSQVLKADTRHACCIDYLMSTITDIGEHLKLSSGFAAFDKAIDISITKERFLILLDKTNCDYMLPDI